MSDNDVAQAATELSDEEHSRRRLARFADYDIDAILSLENAPMIFDRVERMFPPDRRFTYIKMYLDGGMPEVSSGLTRDPRSLDQGLSRRISDEHAGLSIYGLGIMSAGLGTSWPTEREARSEIHRLAVLDAQKWGSPTGVGVRHYKGFTHVHLVGGQYPDGPQGAGEHLTITYTNENGVSTRTILVPEFVDRDEQVRREGVILDQAAAYLRQHYDAEAAADELDDLVRVSRYDLEPLATRQAPLTEDERRVARRYAT